MGPVLVALVIIVVIGICIAAWMQEKKRREALAALAGRLGLRFQPGRSHNLPTQYGVTRLCSQGHSKRASNAIKGHLGDGEVCYFDYKYTVGSGKNSHTYHASACAFHTPCHFTHMIVRPENFFDKAAAMVGFDDIDLDLDEFNRKFFVKCKDKKFAYDILTQRAMEFLLAKKGISMEMIADYCLFHYRSRLSVEKVEDLIRTAAGFLDTLPGYLKEERSARPAVKADAPKSPGTAGRDAFGGIVPGGRRRK